MIRLEEQVDHLHDEGRKQLFLNQKDDEKFKGMGLSLSAYLFNPALDKSR
jgi:hypothetical protein